MKYKLYRQGYGVVAIDEAHKSFIRVSVFAEFEATQPVTVRKAYAADRRAIASGEVVPLAAFTIEGSRNHPTRYSGPGYGSDVKRRKDTYIAVVA